MKKTSEFPFETEAVIWRKVHPDTGVARWLAEYEHNGTPVFAAVSDVDAWNCDIVNELPVRIRVTGPTTCRILARLKNNKKFVRIRTLKKNV